MKLTTEQLRMLNPTRLDLALGFHGYGWNVLPAGVCEKSPSIPWKKYQGRRVTQDELRSWFGSESEINFWIGTGRVSSLLVLDIDNPDAERFWREVVGIGAAMNATACVRTSKGHHYYFKIIGPCRSWSGTGFDVRADGAGVIGAGSVHQTGVIYEWVRTPDEGFLDAPEALRDEAKANASRGKSTAEHKPTLADLLANPAREGGRNDWLARVAGHYAARLSDRAEYDRQIREAARSTTPPMDDDETTKTADSIWGTERRKVERDKVPLADSPLAEWTAERLNSRYCWAGGFGWMRFDGRVWRDATAPSVIEAVRHEFREQYKRELATAETDRARALAVLLNRGKIGAVESLLRGLLERDASDFDNQPDLLNVGNGVVDLRTGELGPHDPSLLLTKITEVAYRPDAKHGDWAAALNALPVAVQAWLQVRFGQAATGYAVPDDLLPLLQGDGRNGKTTFLSGLTSALGDHAVLVSERVLLANPSDHPTELMDLKGARLAWIEETPEGRHLSVHRLKATVGSPILTARRIRQDPVSWQATHSLFLTSNYRLQVAETDHGTWRRLALVRFPYTYRQSDDPRRPAEFGSHDREGDATLRERLRLGVQGQHEAVLAWVVAGAVSWYQEGQVLPPMPGVVATDTEDWRAESDLILAFVRENLEFDHRSAVLTTDLYEEFCLWLNQHGNKPWSDQTFASRFGTHGSVAGRGVTKGRPNAPEVVTPAGRRTKTAGKQRVWFGVRFVGPEQPPLGGV